MIAIPAYRKFPQTGYRHCLLLCALLCADGLPAAVAQEAESEQALEPQTQEAVVETTDSSGSSPPGMETFLLKPSSPRWTLEIKGGHFEPELEEWATYYGGDRTDQAGLAVGYKFLRQVELGLATDYIHDKGVGTLPLNGVFGGDVDFQIYPAHLYLLLRGIFFEDQWVVPYVGGGVTRVYYRQKIDNQASVRGKVEGDHTRAGLQILLDWFDEGNAAGFEEEGVENSYLTVEVVSFNAELEGIELGGKSTQIGFAFEF